MTAIRILFAVALACSVAFAQTPEPSYNPADCAKVKPGSTIEATNNSDVEFIFIQPMLDGVPIGDPVLVPPLGTHSFVVPPASGSTLRLDPTSPTNEFDGL